MLPERFLKLHSIGFFGSNPKIKFPKYAEALASAPQQPTILSNVASKPIKKKKKTTSPSHSVDPKESVLARSPIQTKHKPTFTKNRNKRPLTELSSHHKSTKVEKTLGMTTPAANWNDFLQPDSPISFKKPKVSPGIKKQALELASSDEFTCSPSLFKPDILLPSEDGDQLDNLDEEARQMEEELNDSYMFM